MNNTDHARVRRLRRRANRLGEHGFRIVPHRHGTATRSKEGWHLIENISNVQVAPAVADQAATLDDIEAAIERLEEEISAA